MKEPVIRGLTIRNLLSFGEEPTAIELRPLNVLIGPNGSGKSNLIEVLGLLQNTPKGLVTVIGNGGRIEEWLWKGASNPPQASVEAVVSGMTEDVALRYRLAFTSASSRFEITDELLESEPSRSVKRLPHVYYRFENGRPVLAQKDAPGTFLHGNINPQVSILAQRKDPDHYPEITYLGELFAEFRLYRDWEFGTRAGVRKPCDASLPNAFLEENSSNLGVVLDRLLAIPLIKDQILRHLRAFYEGAKDLRTSVEAGQIQTRLEEEYLTKAIPLVRMSDGTIRWLALLAILLNPDPPRLVCIEEPELGLHPDMIPELAKLLLDASGRMQLIITTQSDRLIEAFTETPEVVLVCEKENGASRFRRLQRTQLSSWLEDYSLGQLWTKGEIGGTRW